MAQNTAMDRLAQRVHIDPVQYLTLGISLVVLFHVDGGVDPVIPILALGAFGIGLLGCVANLARGFKASNV